MKRTKRKAKIYYCPHCGGVMRAAWIKLNVKGCSRFIRIPYVYCPECDIMKTVDDEDEKIIVEKMIRHFDLLGVVKD